jgi:ankyrin repeat protein
MLSTECLQPHGTGLHKAAYIGHKPVVSYLIEMGAELDVRDSQVEHRRVRSTLLSHYEHAVFRMIMSVFVSRCRL